MHERVTTIVRVVGINARKETLLIFIPEFPQFGVFSYSLDKLPTDIFNAVIAKYPYLKAKHNPNARRIDDLNLDEFLIGPRIEDYPNYKINF